MRLVRARCGGRTVLARLEDDGGAAILVDERPSPGADVLRDALLEGADLNATGTAVAAEDLEPLAPLVWPSKIICVGLNYPLHADEADAATPSAPLLFAKTRNTLADPGAVVSWTAGASEQVDYEAELVAIVGAGGSDIAVEDARAAIFGFTAGNDISARDVQSADVQWFRGKSFDGFAPIGPVVVTAEAIDDRDLRVRCRLNGEVMQDSSTAEMTFSLDEIVSYVSRTVTLEPGDLIFTGTPDGVGVTRRPPVLLGDGDVVEVEVEGIGVLRTPIAVRSPRA